MEFIDEFKKNGQERKEIIDELDKFKSFDDIKNNKEKFKELTDKYFEKVKYLDKLGENNNE